MSLVTEAGPGQCMDPRGRSVLGSVRGSAQPLPSWGFVLMKSKQPLQLRARLQPEWEDKKSMGRLSLTLLGQK